MICREFPSLPPVNHREIARYAGIRREPPEPPALLADALAEMEPVLQPRVCWAEVPVCRRDDRLDLGFARVQSRDLSRTLSGCSRAVVFAATLGLGPDRLIARYSRLSPARALLLQAIGTERIEALCDTFCSRLADGYPGLFLSPRFSPGYGDLPLTLQADLFRLLDCPRSIGLTLNESCLMSPSKSVTAIVGLGSCPGTHANTGCRSCGSTDCPYRRMP